MISPKLIGGIVGGIVVVALVAFALSQANKLVKVGEEKARVEAENVELKRQLAEEVERVEAEIAAINLRVTDCNAKVASAVAVGDRWRAQYDSLQGRGPEIREIPIEVESTDCTGALIEASSLSAEPIRRYLREARASVAP